MQMDTDTFSPTAADIQQQSHILSMWKYDLNEYNLFILGTSSD